MLWLVPLDCLQHAPDERANSLHHSGLAQTVWCSSCSQQTRSVYCLCRCQGCHMLVIACHCRLEVSSAQQPCLLHPFRRPLLCILCRPSRPQPRAPWTSMLAGHTPARCTCLPLACNVSHALLPTVTVVIQRYKCMLLPVSASHTTNTSVLMSCFQSQVACMQGPAVMLDVRCSSTCFL